MDIHGCLNRSLNFFFLPIFLHNITIKRELCPERVSGCDKLSCANTFLSFLRYANTSRFFPPYNPASNILPMIQYFISTTTGQKRFQFFFFPSSVFSEEFMPSHFLSKTCSPHKWWEEKKGAMSLSRWVTAENTEVSPLHAFHSILTFLSLLTRTPFSLLAMLSATLFFFFINSSIFLSFNMHGLSILFSIFFFWGGRSWRSLWSFAI